MKILKPSLLFFILFFSNLSIRASHLAGATIWYKNVGKYKYEVFVEVYRDCRGIPFNNPSIQLKNVTTGATSSQTFTLVSITDITPICSKKSKICNPQNQTISSSAAAFEKHIYKGTIDLNTWKSAGACQVLIGAGQCCRNGAITTGAAGNDFWVTAMIDLCKASNNNSPVFGDDPLMSLTCNTPVRYNPAVSDYADNDSLVYELVDPISSWTTKTSWSGSFNSQSPFSVNWPSSYNKSKGPDPKANPPIGFYFNKLNGDIVFTPTDCAEVTITSLRISDYRKDSTTGKYSLLGYATRDFESVVNTNSANNVPTMAISDNIYITDNIKTCFTISTDDKPFTPPPPAKSVTNDTTSLIIFPFTPLKNTTVTFKILDTKAKLKKAEVCWEPKGLARNQPYQMVFKVSDNNCDYYGSSHKSINIYVVKSSDFAWIEGRTYFDANKNCVLDTNDLVIPNQRIQFGTGNILEVESDSTGRFDNAIPAGNYSFKIYDKNAVFVCTKSMNIVKGNRYRFDLGNIARMNITGLIYKDSITDCFKDTTESILANHTVYTVPGNYASTTDSKGKYELKIPAGNYRIKYKPAGANFFVRCGLPNLSASRDTVINYQYIAVSDSSNIVDLTSNIASSFNYTRGGNQEATVLVKNNGSKTVSGTIWFKHNKKLKYVSSTSYILKTDSTIKWNFTNLAAGKELRFYIVLNADASTCQLNDTMTLFSWLDTSGIANDVNLLNNYDSHKIKISGKTNPNIKQEFLTNGYSWREGNKLRYHIQFRNTGKKTINNIWVIDTLHYPISGSSFNMLGASHPNSYSLSNNVLRVDFANINLPDSSTEKIKSKGYFEFSVEIDPKTNSEIKFYNQANIYFDTVFSVKTNKIYTTHSSYVSTGKTNRR